MVVEVDTDETLNEIGGQFAATEQAHKTGSVKVGSRYAQVQDIVTFLQFTLICVDRVLGLSFLVAHLLCLCVEASEICRSETSTRSGSLQLEDLLVRRTDLLFQLARALIVLLDLHLQGIDLSLLQRGILSVNVDLKFQQILNSI